MPILTLWGEKGLVGRLYYVIGTWREKAMVVEGASLPAAHFLPEEVPDETADALIRFFKHA